MKLISKGKGKLRSPCKFWDIISLLTLILAHGILGEYAFRVYLSSWVSSAWFKDKVYVTSEMLPYGPQTCFVWFKVYFLCIYFYPHSGNQV